MTLLGLISDVHATPAPVEEALSIFSKEGVSQVFCAGDIAGYNQQLEQTVKLLQDNNVQTIIGNHDIKYLNKGEEQSSSLSGKYLQSLPRYIEKKIDGKRFYMVHSQPPDENHGGIKLLDKQGLVQSDQIDNWQKILKPFDYEVLIVGHTHQVFSEVIGETLVINPGSTVFNHCCAILSLPDLCVEMIPLSGNKILKTWNWGEHVIYGKKS